MIAIGRIVPGQLLLCASIFVLSCSSPQTRDDMWATASSEGSSLEQLRSQCSASITEIVGEEIRRDVNPTGRSGFLLADPRATLTRLGEGSNACRILADEWPGEPHPDSVLLILAALEDPDEVIDGDDETLALLRSASQQTDHAATAASVLMYDSLGRFFSPESTPSLAGVSSSLTILFGASADWVAAPLSEAGWAELVGLIPELPARPRHEPDQMMVLVQSLTRFIVADLHRLARCAPRDDVQTAVVNFLGLLVRHEQVELGEPRTLAYFERNLNSFMARCLDMTGD